MKDKPVSQHLMNCVNEYAYAYGLYPVDLTTSPREVWPRIERAYNSAKNHPDRKYTARLIMAYEADASD